MGLLDYKPTRQQHVAPKRQQQYRLPHGKNARICNEAQQKFNKG
jgi:hypothetical protein